MLVGALLTDTITIYPTLSTKTDRYGNEVKSKGGGVTVAARVEPLRSPRGDVELLQQRDTLISEYTAYTRPCPSLDAYATVEWQGEIYEVAGEPKEFTEAMGGISHVETYLRIIEG